MRPSSLSSNQVSAFVSDFKSHPDSCASPPSAIITSDETKIKKIGDAKKSTICEEKMQVSKAESIFNKKKRSKSFIKALDPLNSSHLPASRPTSCSLLPCRNDKLSASSEHLVSKFKCSPKLRGFNHETNENVFESATSDSLLHASFKSSSRNITNQSSNI